MFNELKYFYEYFTFDYKLDQSNELYYNYLPTVSNNIFEIFDKFIKNDIKIIDVGSGLGEFMLYLKLYYKLKNVNIIVSGIEMDNIASYVKIPTHFIDAFEFNDYDKFDLIYIYQPIKEQNLMLKLLNLILDYNKNIIFNNGNMNKEDLIKLNLIEYKNTNIWHYKQK